MKSNLFVSLLRMVVPIVAGLLLGWAARVGLDLDEGMVTTQVTAGFTALYYAGFRALEEAAERIGVPWLRTLAGVALGWARLPQYVKPVTAPVRIKLDMKATKAEFVQALRQAEQRGGS